MIETIYLHHPIKEKCSWSKTFTKMEEPISRCNFPFEWNILSVLSHQFTLLSILSFNNKSNITCICSCSKWFIFSSRETPTAAGPNSFGKGNLGFCDRNKMIERNLKKQMEELGEKADKRSGKTWWTSLSITRHLFYSWQSASRQVLGQMLGLVQDIFLIL